MINGEDITFLERYLGDEIDLDDAVLRARSARSTTVLDVAVTSSTNRGAAGLAGPLAPFLPASPTTRCPISSSQPPAPDRADARGDLRGRAGLRRRDRLHRRVEAVLHVMLPDVDRGGVSLQVSYAYLFQNLVSAYENVPIVLTLQKPRRARHPARPDSRPRRVNSGSDVGTVLSGRRRPDRDRRHRSGRLHRRPQFRPRHHAGRRQR